MGLGSALDELWRRDEAVTAYDESVSLYRELVQQKNSPKLRSDMATAIRNRGNALRDFAVNVETMPFSVGRPVFFARFGDFCRSDAECCQSKDEGATRSREAWRQDPSNRTRDT